MIQLVLGCVCVQSAHMLRSRLCIIQPRIYVCWRIARNPGFSSTVHIVLDICVPCEYLFSYNFEIIPLITHIRQILKIDVLKYECNDLFPKVKSDAGTSVAVWSPVVILESCIQSWKYHLIKYSKNILMTCPCCFKKATFNGKYIMSLILYAVSISETLSTEQKWSLVQEALKS